jgi:hypothetical protein
MNNSSKNFKLKICCKYIEIYIELIIIFRHFKIRFSQDLFKIILRKLLLCNFYIFHLVYFSIMTLKMVIVSIGTVVDKRLFTYF